jgi:putative ATP-dependent endonuclease of OLD family
VPKVEEGWAEEILLPPLAKKMKKLGLIAKDLTEAGVSVVNVGGTPFLRYSKIFVRRNPPTMDVPVAILTDVDVPTHIKTPRLDQNGKVMKDGTLRTVYEYPERPAREVADERKAAVDRKGAAYNSQNVKAFVAPNWTLEYCLSNPAHYP